MAKLHFVALRAELSLGIFFFFENFLARRAGVRDDSGMSHLMRAQLGFFPKVTRHEPFDERSARILYAGSPRHSGKSAKSASRVLAGTTGNMAHCPQGWDHGMGPNSYFKEEDDLNSEDAEVHFGGTDVVSTSSTLLVYSVYGVVELLLDSDSAQLTSRSFYSPLTPQGVEGRWQWSSLVAVLVSAQHAQPAALTAFLDR